jgi:hypothetical protein
VLNLAKSARPSPQRSTPVAAPPNRPLVEHAAQATGYRATYVKSEPGLADTLRKWRDVNQMRVSVSGLLMWSIHGALREAGLPVTDECHVLVDLRRFLPDGALTLANFFAVVGVPCGAKTSYDDFGAELHSKTSSPGALVKLVGHLVSLRVRAAVRGRGRFGEPERSADQNSAVHVTISDISRSPALAKINWARSGDAEFAVALPPGSARHIAIGVLIASDGAIHATATFSASLADADTVRTALQRALAAGDIWIKNESIGCENRAPRTTSV